MEGRNAFVRKSLLISDLRHRCNRLYSNVEHIAYVAPKNLKQGYAYRYTCTVDAATSLYDLYGASANSYIVNVSSVNGNGYFFPTHLAGNARSVDWAGINFTEDANEAYPTGGGYSLSGNGVEVILNQNSCVSDVFFANNRIYFKASGYKGNAKLSLTSNGTRVWTWHIWCTDTPGTYSINGYTVMDRNLGATTTQGRGEDNFEEMTGFYYPYGSWIGFTVDEYANGYVNNEWPAPVMKDMFLHPERPNLRDYNGRYIMFNAYYAQNPSGGYYNNEVWGRIWGNGGNKTMYDPCPPGYKVTPYSFWANIGTVTSDYYGIYKNGAFFPFNGFAYQGSYTNYNNHTRRGIVPMDIYLSNAGRSYYEFTQGGRVFMWTSSSNASEDNRGWNYHIRKGNSAGTELADGGIISNYLTRGMGVRCVVGY